MALFRELARKLYLVTPRGQTACSRKLDPSSRRPAVWAPCREALRHRNALAIWFDPAWAKAPVLTDTSGKLPGPREYAAQYPQKFMVLIGSAEWVRAFWMQGTSRSDGIISISLAGLRSAEGQEKTRPWMSSLSLVSALATRQPKSGNPGRKPRKNVWNWRLVGPLPPAYEPNQGGTKAGGGPAKGATLGALQVFG